jgi:hypothetical protein
MTETTTVATDDTKRSSPGLGLLFDELRAAMPPTANQRKKGKRAKNKTTVLAIQNDPYAMDTLANRKLAAWFAEHWRRIGPDRHLRGYHYALLGTTCLNGKLYINDEPTWNWLLKVSKLARWLGFVPFDGISDERNEKPTIIVREKLWKPSPHVHAGYGGTIEMPGNPNLEPVVSTGPWEVEQPYRLVLWGEKTSLRSVLGPISGQYHTDLYLPTGEISDTMLFRMAQAGAADGRPMVVLVFADCDPSGYQMVVSIAHKLRAFKDAFFPNLEFRVLAPALTVEQVQDFGLPSTPLKESEKRADGWRKKHGVEQTEIDALATLHPEILDSIAEDAIAPYFDRTLGARVRHAQDKWQAVADGQLEAAVADAGLEDTKAAVLASFEETRAAIRDYQGQIDDYQAEVSRIGRSIEFPEIVLPDLPRSDVGWIEVGQIGLGG